LRAALIGTGQIARQHLACLRELPDVEVVAVCDLSRARAECMAERFDVAAFFTDSAALLSEMRPDVVHITTPPASHFPLAMAALEFGANVIVEKPAALAYADVEALTKKALERGVAFIEDHNYVFNRATRQIRELIASGEFGEVTHVEAFLCLNILKAGSPFSDPNLPHPSLSMPGAAISDFLTHLASLAFVFIGDHRWVHTNWSNRFSSPLPFSEFRALVGGEHATAMLSFSANTRPDAFWLRAYGTKMQAVANLFGTRLTLSRLHRGPKSLNPLINELQEARDLSKAAFQTLLWKLNGSPGSYEGLWDLLARAYRALNYGAELPVSIDQVIAVNRLVSDLVAEVRPP
jgi:predicted dehydrogenase